MKILIIIMKIKMDLIIGNSTLEKVFLHTSDKIKFLLNYYLDNKSLSVSININQFNLD